MPLSILAVKVSYFQITLRIEREPRDISGVVKTISAHFPAAPISGKSGRR
jgi:hypothetical protein